MHVKWFHSVFPSFVFAISSYFQNTNIIFRKVFSILYNWYDVQDFAAISAHKQMYLNHVANFSLEGIDEKLVLK